MRKSLTTASIAIALASLAFDEALGQKYKDVNVPSKIDVVVAYAKEGGTDKLARIALPYMQSALRELTGKPVTLTVKNEPGAGGEVGWSALARAHKDGSTIGVINLPAIAIVQAVQSPSYAPWTQTFAPIGVNVIDPNVVRINNRTFKTVKDAIVAAKQKAGSVTIGANGPLSDDHLAIYAIEAATGAKFTFKPYSGGAAANRAYLAREVEAGMGNVTDLLTTKDVTVEAAVLADQRYHLIPNTPTFKELTGISVTTGGSTRGWVAPAGTPADVLTVFREAFETASRDKEYIEVANRRKLTLVEPKVGKAFGAIMNKTQKSVDVLLKYFKEGGYLK